MLSPKQLKERALNKIEAKLFFAIKNKQENVLKQDGVIASKMDHDALVSMSYAINREIDVLYFIKDAIDSYTYNSMDDSQLDLEDLIEQMTKIK